MIQQAENRKGFSFRQLLAAVVIAMLLTILVTVFTIKIWLFPKPFTPVQLNQQEEQQLEYKLEQFESVAELPANRRAGEQLSPQSAENDFNNEDVLTPEPYSEQGANREITFSEREINGLLANNTDLAKKMAVDFDENLVSLRLLLPIDSDFPIMGGKTLRVRAGAELAYRQGRPVVMLKGVSLMGVPIPNAWLGGMKNIDLMQEFGGNPGFWQSFGNGVESILVRKGELSIKLRD